MSIRIVLFAIFLVFGTFGYSFAQNVPGVANGSVGKNSRDDYDNGIRLRSFELERIKRENYRAAAAENRRINFSQIKKDFELIQKLESEIVKTYVTGKKINYERIGELSSKLNESARQLETNLSLSDDKQAEKPKQKIDEFQDIKDVIVVLDESIGRFVKSPVFQNLNFFEADDAEKAETELQNIIRLSWILEQKAKLL